MRCRIKRQLTSVGRIGENIIRFGKEDGARSKPMTTASIPELRKAHTRTRAQLARAAARYGKRALAGRGSGRGRSAFGPRSSAAAGAVGCRRGHDGGGSGTPGRRQLATTATALGRCRRSQPRSTVGVVVGGVPAGHGQGRWIRRRPSRLGRHCRRRRLPSAKWTALAASGPARWLTMPATRPRIPADCRVGDEPGRCNDATG